MKNGKLGAADTSSGDKLYAAESLVISDEMECSETALM